jgi:hypothetical protein
MDGETPQKVSRTQVSRNRTRSMLRRNWPAIVILVAFLLIGLAFSIVNPLHEATDELRHYRFIRHLIQMDALPVQGELPCSTQSHHPPLYYATAALLTGAIDTGRDVCYEPPGNPFWAYRYWEVGRDNKNQYLHGPDESFPWRGEALVVHLARMVNLLIGAATVWLTWATAQVIWPDRLALAAGAAGFVAFNPMFLYMAAAINNDVIAALAGAAITYACVRLLYDRRGLSWRWGLGLGLLYGIALMSKFNLAAIIVVIEAALTWVAWRRKQWQSWLIANLIMVGTAAALAGWWFIRNQILYGEPTGFERLTELWGVRDPRDSFWLAVSELPYAWTSLWGRFGYGQIPLPNPIYTGLFIVILLSLLGYLFAGLRYWRAKRVDDEAESKTGGQPRWHANHIVPALLLLALNVAVFFAVLFNYLLVSPAGPMGRFFFPALPSLAILMFFGLSLGVSGTRNTSRPEITKRHWKREILLAWVVNIGMVSLSLIALFGYLAPAYARPATWAEGDPAPNPIDIRFDTLAALRGFAIDPGTIRAGEPVDIELYWEVTGQPPGDYFLFVHLTDLETGTLIAQRDTHPGLGNFPSSQWQPGDRFIERLSLYVPETAYVPAQARLTVGLYAPGAYRLGLVDGATGHGLGDYFSLGEIGIEPSGPSGAITLPNPGNYNFENRIRLLGYEYDQRVLPSGRPLSVTVFWEAMLDNPGDYEIQVRIVDADGAIVAEYQNRPEQGRRPTTGWSPDEVKAETITIPLDTPLAGQTLAVEVALVDTETGRRLNLVHADGRWIDDKLRLSPIAVEN